jgi:hypothetical protein
MRSRAGDGTCTPHVDERDVTLLITLLSRVRRPASRALLHGSAVTVRIAEEAERVPVCEAAGLPVVAVKMLDVAELEPRPDEFAGATSMSAMISCRPSRRPAGLHKPGTYCDRAGRSGWQLHEGKLVADDVVAIVIYYGGEGAQRVQPSRQCALVGIGCHAKARPSSAGWYQKDRALTPSPLFYLRFSLQNKGFL